MQVSAQVAQAPKVPAPEFSKYVSSASVTAVDASASSTANVPVGLPASVAVTTPLDRIEALLAQHRVAQAQLQQDLQAARSTVAGSGLSKDSTGWAAAPNWLVPVVVLLCALVIATIWLTKRSKLPKRGYFRPSLKYASDDSEKIALDFANEEGLAEDFFKIYQGNNSGHNSGHNSGNNLGTSSGTNSGHSAAKFMRAPEQSTLPSAFIPPRRLDLDLDLNLDISAENIEFESTRPLSPPKMPTSAGFAQADLASDRGEATQGKFVSDEVKKVQQSLAQKRLKRHADLVALQTSFADAVPAQASASNSGFLPLDEPTTNSAYDATFAKAGQIQSSLSEFNPDLIAPEMAAGTEPVASIAPVVPVMRANTAAAKKIVEKTERKTPFTAPFKAPNTSAHAAPQKLAKKAFKTSRPPAVLAPALDLIHQGPALVLSEQDQPWFTQLELAQEFYRMGQTLEATDLCNDVIAHTGAPLADRARMLLAEIGRPR